jgi:hypothetical protein
MISCMGTGNTTFFRAVGRACQAVWLLVLACGCTAPQGVERPGGEKVVEELPILWEKSGTWSHVKRPVRVVAYDAATLAQVPVTEVPVDFNTQMVLITALGPTLGPDIGVKITRVWREGPEIRVQEMRVHPGLERSGALERSSPWSVVVVPRCEMNVRNYTSRVPAGLMGDG